MENKDIIPLLIECQLMQEYQQIPFIHKRQKESGYEAYVFALLLLEHSMKLEQIWNNFNQKDLRDQISMWNSIVNSKKKKGESYKEAEYRLSSDTPTILVEYRNKTLDTGLPLFQKFEGQFTHHLHKNGVIRILQIANTYSKEVQTKMELQSSKPKKKQSITHSLEWHGKNKEKQIRVMYEALNKKYFDTEFEQFKKVFNKEPLDDIEFIQWNSRFNHLPYLIDELAGNNLIVKLETAAKAIICFCRKNYHQDKYGYNEISAPKNSESIDMLIETLVKLNSESAESDLV